MPCPAAAASSEEALRLSEVVFLVSSLFALVFDKMWPVCMWIDMINFSGYGS